MYRVIEDSPHTFPYSPFVLGHCLEHSEQGPDLRAVVQVAYNVGMKAVEVARACGIDQGG